LEEIIKNIVNSRTKTALAFVKHQLMKKIISQRIHNTKGFPRFSDLFIQQ